MSIKIRLQKSCKDSTECFCIHFTELPLMLISCVTLIHLPKLRNEHSYTINQTIVFIKISQFFHCVLFLDSQDTTLHLVIMPPQSLQIRDNFLLFPFMNLVLLKSPGQVFCRMSLSLVFTLYFLMNVLKLQFEEERHTGVVPFSSYHIREHMLSDGLLLG